MVDRADCCRSAIDDGEWWDVLDDLGATADERVCSEAAELVDAGESGNDDVVFDFDMAADGGVVGKDAMVADNAVVGDVRVG